MASGNSDSDKAGAKWSAYNSSDKKTSAKTRQGKNSYKAGMQAANISGDHPF